MSFWIFALAAVAIAASLFAWRNASEPPKLVKNVETGKVFFRLKADYTYTGKNGPEPLSFNIVAGCAVKFTEYAFGGSSGRSSRVPTLYALPMSDGGAIMIEVPRACGATTENGRIPKDFMPAVVQYENSKDLSLGMLYASEDAYDSPLAKLKRHGATVEKATEEEFKAFMNGDEFKKNLISIQSSKDLKGAADFAKLTDEVKRDPRTVWKQSMPSTCYGVGRLKAPETLRKYLRSYWKPGKPRYWFLSVRHSNKVTRWLRNHQKNNGNPIPDVLFNGHPFQKYTIPRNYWGGGMVTRRGGGSIAAGDPDKATGNLINLLPADFFPYTQSESPPWLEQNGSDPELFTRNVLIGDEKKKGFFYCYGGSAPGAFEYFFNNSEKNYATGVFPARLYVDGTAISPKNHEFGRAENRVLFFDRDQHILWMEYFVL